MDSGSGCCSSFLFFFQGGIFDELRDEQWKRAMDYVSAVPELNYLTQIIIMLYEDLSKEPTSDDRFHIELHFSPGVVCCQQKNSNAPKGPGFRTQNAGVSPPEPELMAGVAAAAAASRRQISPNLIPSSRLHSKVSGKVEWLLIEA